MIHQIAACLLLGTLSNAFLFPDLKQRSGMSGPSYKIAVLEEEPFLFSNGSGYVPDLLAELAKAHSALHHDKELQLDIVPVRTWKQLMTKAKSTRFQISFGLQIPSLELTNWPGRLLRSTVPALQTSLKVVSKGVIGGDFEERRTQGNEVILTKDSPIEYLLVGVDAYPGSVYPSETLEGAMNALRSASEEAVLLTDAGTADRIVLKEPRNFRSFCPKEIPGTASIHYGFFGKDSTLIGYLNEALLSLLANDALFPIYSRYFPASSQCSV